MILSKKKCIQLIITQFSFKQHIFNECFFTLFQAQKSKFRPFFCQFLSYGKTPCQPLGRRGTEGWKYPKKAALRRQPQSLSRSVLGIRLWFKKQRASQTLLIALAKPTAIRRNHLTTSVLARLTLWPEICTQHIPCRRPLNSSSIRLPSLPTAFFSITVQPAVDLIRAARWSLTPESMSVVTPVAKFGQSRADRITCASTIPFSEIEDFPRVHHSLKSFSLHWKRTAQP